MIQKLTDPISKTDRYLIPRQIKQKSFTGDEFVVNEYMETLSRSELLKKIADAQALVDSLKKDLADIDKVK